MFQVKGNVGMENTVPINLHDEEKLGDSVTTKATAPRRVFMCGAPGTFRDTLESVAIRKNGLVFCVFEGISLFISLVVGAVVGSQSHSKKKANTTILNETYS